MCNFVISKLRSGIYKSPRIHVRLNSKNMARMSLSFYSSLSFSDCVTAMEIHELWLLELQKYRIS